MAYMGKNRNFLNILNTGGSRTPFQSRPKVVNSVLVRLHYTALARATFGPQTRVVSHSKAEIHSFPMRGVTTLWAKCGPSQSRLKENTYFRKQFFLFIFLY